MVNIISVPSVYATGREAVATKRRRGTVTGTRRRGSCSERLRGPRRRRSQQRTTGAVNTWEERGEGGVVRVRLRRAPDDGEWREHKELTLIVILHVSVLICVRRVHVLCVCVCLSLFLFACGYVRVHSCSFYYTATIRTGTSPQNHRVRRLHNCYTPHIHMHICVQISYHTMPPHTITTQMEVPTSGKIICPKFSVY